MQLLTITIDIPSAACVSCSHCPHGPIVTAPGLDNSDYIVTVVVTVPEVTDGILRSFAVYNSADRHTVSILVSLVVSVCFMFYAGNIARLNQRKTIVMKHFRINITNNVHEISYKATLHINLHTVLVSFYIPCIIFA